MSQQARLWTRLASETVNLRAPWSGQFTATHKTEPWRLSRSCRPDELTSSPPLSQERHARGFAYRPEASASPPAQRQANALSSSSRARVSGPNRSSGLATLSQASRTEECGHSPEGFALSGDQCRVKNTV
ncbi:hypothetical protein SKAU_G00017740 [Synaphobranchus kaupii]|uniref:Uncharacterized protein n=1 Tax=Synaphobranchus kaupii TaxID=118154 RepID=A0A9Q1JBW5_SYNKA|nr:hypothetical protein SKAU_G00017740 [Synaphobranchus kaupii]